MKCTILNACNVYKRDTAYMSKGNIYSSHAQPATMAKFVLLQKEKKCHHEVA